MYQSLKAGEKADKSAVIHKTSLNQSLTQFGCACTTVSLRLIYALVITQVRFLLHIQSWSVTHNSDGIKFAQISLSLS